MGGLGSSVLSSCAAQARLTYPLPLLPGLTGHKPLIPPMTHQPAQPDSCGSMSCPISPARLGDTAPGVGGPHPASPAPRAALRTVPREASDRCAGSHPCCLSLPRALLLSCIVGGPGPPCLQWPFTGLPETRRLSLRTGVGSAPSPMSVPSSWPRPPVCLLPPAPSSVPGTQNLLNRYLRTGDGVWPVCPWRPEKTS